MTETPFFSIILPTFNRATMLNATVDCILHQTFAAFELIIIDDASTDHTFEVIHQYQDQRIIYIKNETNKERSASRNRGIDAAKGQYITFCDSDDHWREQHLQVLYDAIIANQQKEAFYYTGMTWNFPDRTQDVLFPNIAETGLTAVEYAIKYQIAPSTTCIPTSILQKNKFNIQITINEDIELFTRIVKDLPLYRITKITVDFMIHPNNTRGLIKDYITPQIQVMHYIFTDSERLKWI